MDDAAWPVVEVFVEGVVSDEEVVALTEQVDACVQRGQHAIIVDLTTNEKVQFEHLRMVGEWVRERGPSMKPQKASVFVVKSPFMRAAVNFVFDMFNERGNFRIVSDQAEAHEFVNNALAELAS